MSKLSVLVISLVGLAVPSGSFQGSQPANTDPVDLPAPTLRYELGTVTRGMIVDKVMALGTVQPITSVVVGSQVSGEVREVLVDYNDVVAAGQPIARIDPELFLTRVAQARSDVDVSDAALRIAEADTDSAAAAVVRAEADVAQSLANLRRGEVIAENAARARDRKVRLMRSGLISDSETEDAQAAHEVALADVGAAEALVAAANAKLGEARGALASARMRVAHAQAQLERSRAFLRQAEADLERTIIRAPADGIVLDRSVSPGLTVAASFQAPSLFTIGDLGTVAVELAIDEADIGRVRPGQTATFSVDAYPEREFSGSITQIRRTPHVQDTVVTYTVVFTAANDDLLLLPGMTALASVVTEEPSEVMEVPMAALRYRPGDVAEPAGPQVWVLDDRIIRPVSVEVGAGDGEKVAVTGALRAGEAVVIADSGIAEDPRTGARFADVGALVSEWIAPVRTALAEIAMP